MSTVFSTESFAQKDRFSYWHDVVSKFYAPCIGITQDQDRFNATTTVNRIGSAEVSTVVSESIRYDRRPADLRAIPREDIFLSVMLEGSGFFSQNNRQVAHNKGDVLIYDSAKPYSFNYTSSYNAILLRVPRPLVQSKITRIDDLGGTILSHHSAYGHLVKSLMHDTSVIASSAELAQDDDFIVPTLEMLTTALAKATNNMPSLSNYSSHTRLLNEIKAYIRDHITDEDLSLEQVAKYKNISLRTLSRVFAESGETPRSWLQSQRLSCAYEALVNRKVSNVTEAALTFGYKDLSHFSRTFKKCYGYSPKELTR